MQVLKSQIQNFVGFPAVWKLADDIDTGFHCFDAAAGFPEHIRQDQFKIDAVGFFIKPQLDLGDGLIEQIRARVHFNQGAAREADLVWFNAVALVIQALQFILQRGIGRLQFKSHQHVFNGLIHLTFVFMNETQADVGNEIVGKDGKDDIEYPFREFDILLFQEVLAQLAVGFNLLGKFSEDIGAMRKSLFNLMVFDQPFNFPMVFSQCYIRHELLFLPRIILPSNRAISCEWLDGADG